LGYKGERTIGEIDRYGTRPDALSRPIEKPVTLTFVTSWLASCVMWSTHDLRRSRVAHGQPDRNARRAISSCMPATVTPCALARHRASSASTDRASGPRSGQRHSSSECRWDQRFL